MHAAAGAEDQAQRKWHKQLLSVLTWLLPKHSANHYNTHTSNSSTASASLSPPLQSHTAVKPEDMHSPSKSTDVGKQENAHAPEHCTDPLSQAHAAAGFDAAELYAAVKPTGNEAELAEGSTKLRPTLRPYQKRAAAWMVSREQEPQVPQPSAVQVSSKYGRAGVAPTSSQILWLRLAVSMAMSNVWL